jgi:hypothetical protein
MPPIFRAAQFVKTAQWLKTATSGIRTLEVGINAPSHPLRWPHADVAIVFSLIFLRWLTGFPARAQLGYWYLSYAGGFFRRGFVGTFTMPFLVNRPLGTVLIIVFCICFVTSSAILFLLIHLLHANGLQSRDPVFLVFIASNALPWLASDLGTMDTFSELIALIALALALRRNRVAAVFCVIAPLVHEGALFLLMPLLLGLFVMRPERRGLAVACGAAAAAASLVLWLFSTEQLAWPAGMPSGVFDEEFVRWQLTQHFQWFPVHITSAIAISSILPCVMIAVLVWCRAGALHAVVVAAGVAATWSICLIASTDERFFAWGPLTAVVLAALALRSIAIAAPVTLTAASARAVKLRAAA